MLAKDQLKLNQFTIGWHLTGIIISGSKLCFSRSRKFGRDYEIDKNQIK